MEGDNTAEQLRTIFLRTANDFFCVVSLNMYVQKSILEFYSGVV